MRASGVLGESDAAVTKGVYATSFDETGTRVASRVLKSDDEGGASSLGLKDAVALAGGRAFVLLRDQAVSELELLRVDRQLRTERRTAVRAPERFAGGARAPALDALEVSLFSLGAGLRVAAPETESTVELSPSGTETRRIPKTARASSCSTAMRALHHDVRVGSEHVTLSYGAKKGPVVEVSIRWTEATGEEATLPPCPGAL